MKLQNIAFVIALVTLLPCLILGRPSEKANKQEIDEVKVYDQDSKKDAYGHGDEENEESEEEKEDGVKENEDKASEEDKDSKEYESPENLEQRQMHHHVTGNKNEVIINEEEPQEEGGTGFLGAFKGAADFAGDLNNIHEAGRNVKKIVKSTEIEQIIKNSLSSSKEESDKDKPTLPFERTHTSTPKTTRKSTPKPTRTTTFKPSRLTTLKSTYTHATAPKPARTTTFKPSRLNTPKSTYTHATTPNHIKKPTKKPKPTHKPGGRFG